MLSSSIFFLRRFRRDRRAAVLVWFALTLPIILGMFALSLDLGRLETMNTQLKYMADAAALAAANKLDGTENAIVNANAAAAALANQARFADSGGTIKDLVYAASYSDLVKKNYIANEGVSADAKKAAYV